MTKTRIFFGKNTGKPRADCEMALKKRWGKREFNQKKQEKKQGKKEGEKQKVATKRQ
jgi:hypothetical protein